MPGLTVENIDTSTITQIDDYKDIETQVIFIYKLIGDIQKNR